MMPIVPTAFVDAIFRSTVAWSEPSFTFPRTRMDFAPLMAARAAFQACFVDLPSSGALGVADAVTLGSAELEGAERGADELLPARAADAAGVEVIEDDPPPQAAVRVTVASRAPARAVRDIVVPFSVSECDPRYPWDHSGFTG